MGNPEQNLAQKSHVSDRQIFDKIPGFIAILAGPDHTFEYANQSFFEIADHRKLIGLTIREAFPDLDGQGFYEALDKVYRTGVPFEFSGAAIQLDDKARKRYVDLVYQPILDDDGAVLNICIAGHEVTAHVEAIQQAERSESELQTLTDALPVLISYMDADQRYQFNNKLYEEWFPFKREEIHGQTIRSVIGEKAYELVRDKIDRVLAGERFQFEQTMPYSTTAHRHIKVEYVPRKAENGAVEGWYALVQDITRTKRLEQQKDEVTRELAHRIKNQLAVVQSIVSQTLRRSESLEEAREVVNARIGALGRAQDMLIGLHWESAEIRDIVGSALKPYESSIGQFLVEGGAGSLNAQQSLSLSLGLHELATNALKYGALSNENGRVAIRWSVGSKGEFEFTWTERGGPSVNTPDRLGFGTRLIDRMVAPAFDGKTEIDYDAQGIRFSLSGNLNAASERG
ncbi:MAG: PAS domain-containing protein [Rhizobiaceae bacterium]|nr:PAS domain-containing protein [Rhizobiaceae bacterium]